MNIMEWMMSPLASLHRMADAIIYQPGVTKVGKDYMVLKCESTRQVYVCGYEFPYQKVAEWQETFQSLRVGDERVYTVVDPELFDQEERITMSYGAQLTSVNEHHTLKYAGRTEKDMALMLFTHFHMFGIQYVDYADHMIHRFRPEMGSVPLMLSLYSANMRLVKRFQKDTAIPDDEDPFAKAYNELAYKEDMDRQNNRRVSNKAIRLSKRLEHFAKDFPSWPSRPEASLEVPSAKRSRIE
jgi:hypothetical protein